MMTLRANGTHRSIDSRNRNSNQPLVALPTKLERKSPGAGFNLDLPITSRREGFGAALGDLSLNLNGGYAKLSDFGRLWEKGAGLNWGATEKLRLTASLAWQDSAPGLSDLGAPQIVTPGVTLYDFARSETVVATIISGGNRALAKERRRDLKLSAFWQVPIGQQTTLIAEYFDNRSRNSSNSFPLLTSEVETAFADRVSRDASGRLLAIDQRSVTFADRRSELLRFGFNVGGTVGKPDPARAGAGRGPGGGMGGGGMGGGMARPGGGGPSGGGPAGGGGGRGGPGMFGGGGRGGPGMFGGGGNGQGRWSLSLVYSPRLTETVLIAPGLAQLDLLAGSAIGGDGGISRHSFEAEGGLFYRGMGMRFSATHDSGSRVLGSGLPGSSDLEFGTLTRLNMRMFVDFDQMPKLLQAAPFLKSSRLGLRVDNVLGTVRTVRDESGVVPLRYQPGLTDPRGRVFGLFLRKIF